MPNATDKAERSRNVQHSRRRLKHVHVDLSILIHSYCDPKHRHCWALLFWAPWGLKELFRLFQRERFQNAKWMPMWMCHVVSPKDGCIATLSLGANPNDWLHGLALKFGPRICDQRNWDFRGFHARHVARIVRILRTLIFFPQLSAILWWNVFAFLLFLNSDTISTDIFQALCGTIWPHHSDHWTSMSVQHFGLKAWLHHYLEPHHW